MKPYERDPQVYMSDSYVVLDFEITNKKKGDAREPTNDIVYGYLLSGRGSAHEVRSVLELADCIDWILDHDFIVAHNAKFELQWLSRAGLKLEKVLPYCTMIAEYVRAGNRRWKLSLDEVSARYGVGGKSNLVSRLIRGGVCPSEIPTSLLEEYCRKDVALTRKLMLAQRQALLDDGLLPVTFMRNVFTPVVAEMEMNGMALDGEKVQQVHAQYVARLIEIEQELDQITGGINMASPRQVSVFMYKTLGIQPPSDARGRPLVGLPTPEWPGGMPKTDKITLVRVRPTNQRQKRFLDLMQEASILRKKISAYTQRFVKVVEEDGGLLYGSLNQTITATHRLSSTNPNLQNIDRALKGTFTARREGWLIGNADYSQLEFRTAGLLSQDRQVLDDIHNSADVHSFTASVIFGDEFDSSTGEVRKEFRNQAKRHTFKPLYGGSSGTANEQRYYKAFREKYPGVVETQQAWIDEVLETGQLRLPTGLIAYWEDTKYTQRGWVTNSTKIMNYPVQQFATADLATIGVMLLYHAMKERGLRSFLINEVHDSALIEVHPDEVNIVTELAHKYMAEEITPWFRRVISFDINYPIEIEFNIGSHWGG